MKSKARVNVFWVRAPENIRLQENNIFAPPAAPVSSGAQFG